MSAPPLSAAELAACTAGYTTQLGAGASDDVFAGALPSGVPCAVKRLRAPPGAAPAALAGLRRRFLAELATLASYQHPCIVRLLGACEATGEPAHPCALVFELLAGGSLADWLKAPGGEAPPPRGALTTLQRCDAALGIAHGLQHLRGLREAGEDGAQAPVVHCDGKSANVCFALMSGGELYAKVIDCGLAKALRGGAVGAPAAAGGGGGGAFFSAGVLGTPGYMAPELADGDYAIPSEVYSFGVVLLELLTGRRVGLKTASAARECAEDEGAAHVAALAEGCWPPPAAAALAALVVDCTPRCGRRRRARLAAFSVAPARRRGTGARAAAPRSCRCRFHAQRRGTARAGRRHVTCGVMCAAPGCPARRGSPEGPGGLAARPAGCGGPAARALRFARPGTAGI